MTGSEEVLTVEEHSRSRLQALTGHIPNRQVLRYVLVGACNTGFGYLVFAGLTALFTRITSFYPYVFAAILSNVINITGSFLGYKWFVFKTRGNYLREWARAMAVYTTSITITTIALPLLVGFLRHTTRYPRAAPYIAGAIICAASVTMSFFGHKHFSFRPARQADAADPETR
jgi:putative flippase GtrA